MSLVTTSFYFGQPYAVIIIVLIMQLIITWVGGVVVSIPQVLRFFCFQPCRLNPPLEV